MFYVMLARFQRNALGLAVLFVASGTTVGQTLNPPALTLRRIGISGLGEQRRMSLSPDGGRFAFTEGPNVYVRDLATGNRRALTNLGGNDRASGAPVWSPDGRLLAYLSGQLKEIVIISPDSRTRRTLYRVTDDRVVWPAAWSPDGKQLLAVIQSPKRDSGSLLWLPVDGSSPQQIATRSVPDGDVFISPDGLYIAFTGRIASSESTPWSLHVISRDGLEETDVSIGFVEDERIAGWTRDGSHIMSFHGSALWAVPVRNGKPNGSPVMIERKLSTSFHGGSGLWPLGTTTSGALFFVTAASTSDIYTAPMDPVTGKVVAAPKPLPLPRAGANVLPRWSPDGLQILYHFVEWAPADNFVFSLGTKRERRVAAGVPGAAICWADGGSSILLIPSILSTGYGGLQKVGLESGEASALVRESDNFFPVTCAGNLVGHYTQSGIRVRDTSSGKDWEVYHFSYPTGTSLPALSHNAKAIAFVASPAAGSSALLTVPSDGGAARELVRLKGPAEFQQVYFGVTWSPDDRFVYYLRRENQTSPYELWRVPAAGGAEQNANLRFADLQSIDIAPDGKTIAFAVGPVGQSEIWSIENFLQLQN